MRATPPHRQRVFMQQRRLSAPHSTGRVPPLPASLAAPAGCPGSDRFRGQPHRHIAASNEGLIVGWPVRNAVLRLIRGMNLRLHPCSVAPAEGPEKCGPSRPTPAGSSCNNAQRRGHDGQVKQSEQEVLHARDSVGQTSGASGATQRCLNPGVSERIGNSRRTGRCGRGVWGFCAERRPPARPWGGERESRRTPDAASPWC